MVSASSTAQASGATANIGRSQVRTYALIVSLFLGLLPLFRHVFPLMRYTFVSAAIVLYATFLGPAFYHLWIYAGSGNANFFYAITLVWSLGQSLLVADLMFAVLRDEWEVERPEMAGKEIRQI